MVAQRIDWLALTNLKCEAVSDVTQSVFHGREELYGDRHVPTDWLVAVLLTSRNNIN